MIRMVLFSLLLVSVPFLIYFLYDLARRGPDGTGAQHPRDWERETVLNHGLAGLGLAAIGLVVLLVFSGGSSEGSYVPARIENGKLIDGGFNLPDGSLDRGDAVE